MLKVTVRHRSNSFTRNTSDPESWYEGIITFPGVKGAWLTNLTDGKNRFSTLAALKAAARSLGTRTNQEVVYEIANSTLSKKAAKTRTSDSTPSARIHAPSTTSLRARSKNSTTK